MMDRRAVRLALAWLVVTTSTAVLLFLYKYLGAVAEGERVSPLDPLITEFTGAFGFGILVVPLFAFMRRVPLLERDGSVLAGRLPAYAGALVLFAIAHTSFMWGSRLVLFPLAGLGGYDYGAMPLRYLMEFPIQFVGFCIFTGALHASWRLEEARRRKLHAMELEASLARAQLQNLRLQIQPHFLFNALNTISSAMYSDPAAADEMIERLSDLLRVSLRTAQTDEVPLSEELETLESYLAIMRARFGERLDVRIDVAPDVRGVRVPSMILQPLVENAIRHGNAGTNGTGRVELRALRSGDRLRIEIENDGAASRSGDARPGHGVGLTTTIDRLRILYGDAHAFEAKATEGRFRVAMEIPMQQVRA